MLRTHALAALATLLVACVPVADRAGPPQASADASPGPSRLLVEVIRSVEPPPGTPERCFARDDAPPEAAFLPDPDGLPALWFETPCGAETDAERIAALQRALAARALMAAPVTGRLDPATREAIARYQAPMRLRSQVLSLAAARELGLAVWEPAPAPDA